MAKAPVTRNPFTAEFWKIFTSRYWDKRRADHRPPPLKTLVNKQGQDLEWQGPAHRKNQAEQAQVNTEREQHRHPELHRKKQRNLCLRFYSPQQVSCAYRCKAIWGTTGRSRMSCIAHIYLE